MEEFALGGPNASAWLAGLLDSAMDAIITVDEAQQIVLYNRAAERIFGWRANEMLGGSLNRLLPERYRARHGEHLQRFGATGTSSRRMSGSSVVYGLRADGTEFPVDASISQLDTPEGKLYTVILRDVTERVESEQAQLRLAARLSGLLDSAMDGIVTIDASQKIILFNRAAEHIFGWPAPKVIGRSVDMLIPERFRGAHRDHVAAFAATGVTSRRMGGALLLGIRAGGDEFPIEASISQLDSQEGKLLTVILRDVTDRVRAQEELAASAAQANGVREQEKSRIARELHDELAQSLTALKMDANWVRDHINESTEAALKLGQMQELLDEAVAATRRIAADLRPLVLDDLGLIAGMEWLRDRFTQRHDIRCRLDVDRTLDLEEPYATALFRILQELLVNVGKHAQARSVEIRLARDAREVVMVVEDDGVGFSVEQRRKPQSLGLVGVRERARLLRGSVALTSEAGKGTRIETRIPLGASRSDDTGRAPDIPSTPSR